jgi:hypothetical protein
MQERWQSSASGLFGGTGCAVRGLTSEPVRADTIGPTKPERVGDMI